MQATKLTCPDCHATLQLAKPVPPGAKIKCPKCGTAFAPAAASGPANLSGARPTTKSAAAKTQPASPSPRSGPRKVDDDDDDFDDRPRKKKKKFREKEKSNSGMMVAVVVILLVVLAGGGIGGYFLFFGGDNKPTEVAKYATNAGDNAARYRPGTPPNPGSGIPPNRPQGGPPNRPPFDPNNPPNRPPFNGGQPPMPPTGSANPLQDMKFDQIDFGNLAAKNAAQLDALNYLPADCSAIVGVDVGNLTSIKSVPGIPETASRDGGDLHGVPSEQIDQIVVGSSVPLTDFFELRGQSLQPKQDAFMTMVVKTKTPYDAEKVRKATQAGGADQLEGKTVYRLKGAPSLLYMPSDKILVFSHLPQDQIPGLLSVKGDQPAFSAELQSTVAKIGPAHAWLAFSSEQMKGLPSGGNQAVTDALEKAKGASLSLQLTGKKIRLSAGVVCGDADSSKKLTTGLQLIWNLLAKNILETAKSQFPNLSPLVTDVQNLQFKNHDELALVALDVNFASFEPLKNMGQDDWQKVGFALGGALASQGGGLAGGAGGGNRGGGKPAGDSPGAGAQADDNTPEGLAEGQRAPDIEGKDTDGKEFKLSEYRGKVILLDFWGHW